MSFVKLRTFFARLSIPFSKLSLFAAKFYARDWVSMILLALAFLLYMIIIVPSGSHYCFEGDVAIPAKTSSPSTQPQTLSPAACGLYFWGAHEHDAIWHLALIENAFDHFPFDLPIFAGHNLVGYNFLFDLILFFFTKLGFSASWLYFKAQALVWFFAFAFLLHQLAKNRHPEPSFRRWLYFIVFFSTSFGILIRLFQAQTLTGSIGVPSMQGALGMTNPQFMWSLVVLLALILSLTTRRYLWSIAPLVFLGLGFKFYFIVPALVFIGYHSFVWWRAGKTRLVLSLIFPTILALSFAYFLFYRNPHGGGLRWDPFALVHLIVEDAELWYSPQLVSARYSLQASDHWWQPRLWAIEAWTGVLFVFFHFGLRLLGILGAAWLIWRRRREMGNLLPYLLAIFASTAPVFLFVQVGVWWNTIQFLYYALFLASILLAEVSWQLSRGRPRWVAGGLVIFFLLFFLPSNLEMWRHFTSARAVRYLAEEELAVLAELKRQPAGVVLQAAFQERRSSPELPDWYDAAYLPAFGGQTVYLANGSPQLELLNIPFQEQLTRLRETPCSLLDQVTYVYLRKPGESLLASCLSEQAGWQILFGNSRAEVWARHPDFAQ